MGQRGPKQKPQELKLLEGTYRPDRAPEKPVSPPKTAKAPSPPSYLDTVGKKEWKRLAPVLYKLGLLTMADIGTFEAYCQAYSQFVMAAKSLNKAGELTYRYTNKGGVENIVARPEIGIIKSTSQMIRQLAAEFGCTPSARARMEAPEIIPPGGAPPTKTEKKDTFEGFMNGPKKRDLSG